MTFGGEFGRYSTRLDVGVIGMSAETDDMKYAILRVRGSAHQKTNQ